MTDSQVSIVQREVNAKINFDRIVQKFVEENEELISQGIHCTKRAMEKAYDADPELQVYDVDPELLKDYQAIDEDPNSLKLIDAVLFSRLREAIDDYRMKNI